MSQPPDISEFDLIRRYFAHITAPRPDVTLGIGDDAALVSVPTGCELAISVDTLVSGVHFLPSVSAEALGHKSLAVNLSDMAAMGAEPAWATLALTLPTPEPAWLMGFATGFATLAGRHGLALIGGDTTRGPLSVTVQLHGLVPEGMAMHRSGARVGDEIYVTGHLGDAALALKRLHAGRDIPASLRQRLERPEPRVEAGIALREVATAAIDISDGLLADLGHILESDSLGARIELARLPLSEALTEWIDAGGDWSPVLAGGDDYELCFTAAPGQAPRLARIASRLGLAVSCIGSIESTPGLRALMPDGSLWSGGMAGFDHFAGEGLDDA